MVKVLGYSEHSVVSISADRRQIHRLYRRQLQRMDRSFRCHWPALLTTFIFLVVGVLTHDQAEAAPVYATTDALAPPPTEDSMGMLNDALRRITYPEPATGRRISFFKNHQCRLHAGNAGEKTATQSVICGLRELDLPEEEGDGVRFWLPRKCQKYHCQCLATRDVNREKRTISDNKTDIVYKRFRVFECV